MRPAKPRFAVVTDFDGTVTTFDIGDSICLHFGVTDRAELEKSYEPGASVKVWMRRLLGRLRQPPQKVRAFVLKNSVMRRGFAASARRLAASGVPLEIASGGVDLYIDTLLDSCATLALVKVRAGRAAYRGGAYSVSYPGIKAVLDDFKAARVRHYRKQGYKVIFCGDATSDLKAAREADFVFACGRLTKMCRKAGIKTRKLDDFGAVARLALGGQ